MKITTSSPGELSTDKDNVSNLSMTDEEIEMHYTYSEFLKIDYDCIHIEDRNRIDDFWFFEIY